MVRVNLKNKILSTGICSHVIGKLNFFVLTPLLLLPTLDMDLQILRLRSFGKDFNKS